MPLTRVTKIGDGTTSVFNVNFTLGYIAESHVKAWLDGEVDGLGEIVYRTITFNSYDMLELSGDPPGDGVEVYFERTVPKDALLVNFSDGDNLSEANIDMLQLQMLHIVHEAIDGRIGPIASNFDMGGYRLINIAEPVDPSDVATREFVLSNSDTGGAGGAAGAVAGAAAAAAAVAAFIAQTVNYGERTVTRTKLALSAVGQDELADGAVDNLALADGAINARTIDAADIAALRTVLGLDTLVTPVATIIDSLDPDTPAGYLRIHGTTVGSAASGATGFASALAYPLYAVLWKYSNTVLPIQTSTGTLSSRGVSAASDFAANKRMPLVDIRGIFRRAADESAGKDAARVPGTVQADGMRSHTHVFTGIAHAHTVGSRDDAGEPGGGTVSANNNSPNINIGTTSVIAGGTNAAQSGATADTRPENLSVYVYIKY